jgi:hypothetical protein
MKMRAFWDIAPRSLIGVDRRLRGANSTSTALIMEAISTSETLVYSNETTLPYTPERLMLSNSAVLYLYIYLPQQICSRKERRSFKNTFLKLKYRDRVDIITFENRIFIKSSLVNYVTGVHHYAAMVIRYKLILKLS